MIFSFLSIINPIEVKNDETIIIILPLSIEFSFRLISLNSGIINMIQIAEIK